MKISVIIPCHNAEQYLAQTLGSVLEQTRPVHEVIVVNDGSTDASLDIARRFEAEGAGQFRVLSHRSGSASRTRNVGALLATGEALMFLDADDVLGPDALAGLAEALARHPAGVAACPWYRLEQQDERWVERPPSCLPRAPGQDPLDAWLRGWYQPPCSVLWSRAAFEQTGRWDELTTVNDDGDLMMRALAQGTPLLETTFGSAYYRRLPEGEVSLSGKQFTAAGIESRLRVIRKVAAWLAEYGRAEKYHPALRQALWLIAADARGQHPDLYHRAATMAEQFAPPIWTRAAQRALRLMERSDEADEPEPEHAAEPIRFGLDRAEQVMARPPTEQPASEIRLNRPTVSVIIPTYNRARLLPRALGSVLDQTLGDYEILVIDDGSTDDTEAIMRGYDDPRIHYLKQPKNAGVSAARNRGLREARGEFIAFLDSDDTWFPRKLEVQVARFRELPDDVGLLYGAVENEDDRGERTIIDPTKRGDVYRELLRTNVIHGTSGVMLRRSVVATAGFFDEGIPAIEDYDYWLRVTRFFKIDFVDEPLIRYHDPHGIERKSLNFKENMDARDWLFAKHAAAMRREGVADLFLLESTRRHLLLTPPDLRGARRLALQTVRQVPGSRTAWGALRRLMLPGGGNLFGLRDRKPESASQPPMSEVRGVA